MARKKIDWSKGRANELLQMYVDEILSVEAKMDNRIAKELGCTPDAIHIELRRVMKDNPDSKNRKRITKVKGWQKRLFGKPKKDDQLPLDFEE